MKDTANLCDALVADNVALRARAPRRSFIREVGGGVMKAHDVRHLTVCPKCGDVGDDRKMPKIGSQHMHPVCAYRLHGSLVLRLPNSERAKFTLDSVGPIVMRKMLAIMDKP